MYQYKRNPLSNEEADRLVNACKYPREKLLIILFLDTGIRVSEMVNLAKQNIMWQERRLEIFGKGGPFGKKSKRRIIPLTERAFTILSNWFTLYDSVGIKRLMIEIVIKRVAQRAGIMKNVTPHVLRHTFAIRVVQKGISTRALQQFLGHDHLTTTEIYLNMSPEIACTEFVTKF